MTKHLSIKNVLWVALLVVLIAVWPLHRRGFCISEWRFVTDEEALLSGIMTRFVNHRPERQRDPENIAAARKLLSENPDCCRLLHGPEEDKFIATYYLPLEVYLGSVSRIILVGGSLSDTTDGDAVSEPSFVPITSCGVRGGEVFYGQHHLPKSKTVN